MMHSCEACPSINALKSYLNQFFINQFFEDNIGTEGTSTDEEINLYFNEAEVKFLQWITIDRTELSEQSSNLENFIDKL